MPAHNAVPTLAVGDIARVSDFYQTVLGFAPALTLGWLADLAAPGDPAARLRLVGGSPKSGTTTVTVEVDDAEAAYQRAVAQHATIVREPWTQPAGVRRFIVEDPDGRAVTVTGNLPAEPRPTRESSAPPENSTGSLILLSGPPGVGKSTVGRLLAARLMPCVLLRSDDFWQRIETGLVAPYLPEAQRQNEIVMRALATAASAYATGGYHVIIDGVVGPWFLTPWRQAAERETVPLHYIVLRADEATTLARGVARGVGELTDEEPLRLMYGQFADMGEYEPYVCDTTAADAMSTVLDVLHHITSGSRLLSH